VTLLRRTDHRYGAPRRVESAQERQALVLLVLQDDRAGEAARGCAHGFRTHEGGVITT
jgi:hypothetical protein